MTTSCPAGCGRTQKPGTFLCAPCWHKLPSGVRGALTRAWHDLGMLDKIKSPVAYRAAIRNYRLAREGALEWLASNPAMTPERSKAEDFFRRER